MTLRLFSGLAQQHACDSALGVLLAPRSSGTALCLFEPSPEAGALIERVDLRGRDGGESSRREAPATPIAIDAALELPFRDASVELALVCLEKSWPGSARAQQKLISELQRVLAPGGEALAVLRRPGSSTTRRSLGRVLGRNGFYSLEWFVPLRSGSGRLTEIRPLQRKEGLWRGYQPAGFADRVRHLHWFGGDFVVRASSEKLQPCLLQRCLESVSQEGAVGHKGGGISVERLLVTPKEKVVALVEVNARQAVMRIPLSRSALEGCRNNMGALRALRLSGVDVAPLPLDQGQIGPYSYALESRIRGQPMRNALQAHSDLALLESLMRRLNPDARAQALEGETYAQLISAPLRKLSALSMRGAERDALAKFFSSRLCGKHVGIGISHGDLSISNVYVKDNSLSGLIDWDDSRLDGLPILDAISHLCSRQFRRSANFPETFSRLAARQWPEAQELSFLDRCYDYFRTDPSCHSALVFAYWLGVVARHLDFWYGKDPVFLQTRVRAVVDTIIADHVRHAAIA